MNGLQVYQCVNIQISIIDVDFYKLIQLLYNGVIECINMVKVWMQVKDYEGKGKFIIKVIEIIGGLCSFLDFEKGGDFVECLEGLYDYMECVLFEVNVKNDVVKFDEVFNFLCFIKEGWDGICEEVVFQQQVG